MPLTVQQLREALDECLDVEEHEVRELLDSDNRDLRVVASLAVARTKIRQALFATQRLAKSHNYQDQASVTAVERLANLSDCDEPYIEMLKEIGIQAAAAGRLNAAMQYLQIATTRGAISGQRKDKRSRPLMRYGHDREIDAAIASLAKLFPPPSFADMPPIDPFRLAITVSAIQDEDGPTVVIMKRAEHFKRLGCDVSVVSTGVSVTNSPSKLKRLADLHIPFFLAPDGDVKTKIDWLIAHFQEHPAHAISCTTSLYDNAGKLAAVIGLAPVQSWENRSLEPYVGTFDLVLQAVRKEQEQITEWPGISKFYGQSAMMMEEIDAASPWPKAMLGVPDDAIALGTFGRLEKCNTSEYLDAMSRILKSDERLWLVLAGRDGLGALDSIQRRFQREGVWNRVKYLGPRQDDGPSLVKSIDLYCDTYPWVGGQILTDAMLGGRAIVAMKAANDPDLDPTGVSATTSIAESVLPDTVELARAGNIDDYVRIALRYIGDAELRARDGAINYAKVKRDYDPFDKSRRYAEDLRAIYARKMGITNDPGFPAIDTTYGTYSTIQSM